VVQEETSKASKRARRRAAGEEGAENSLEEETAEAETAEVQVPAAPAPAPGGTGVPNNRQGRRSAAAKARAQRKQERVEASAIGLDTGEMVDDALVRLTDKISRFGRRNWDLIQWVIGLSIIGGVGFQIYTWRMATVEARVSDALFVAIQAERGTIGDPKEQGKPNANGIVDPTPIFENDGARLAAALAGYRKAAELRPGSVAEGFARLGEGGVLFETGKADEALAVYDKLLASSVGQSEPDLRAGALQGRALCLEAKNDLPAARHAFEDLTAIGGFENEGLYQQARIAQRQGDAATAKTLLAKLFKALGAPKPANPSGLPDRPEFSRERAVLLAGVVDPQQKDVKIPEPPLGADAVQRMLEQLQEQGVAAPTQPSP
jgi:tetratricopeptide (TPR) repeat protein